MGSGASWIGHRAKAHGNLRHSIFSGILVDAQPPPFLSSHFHQNYRRSDFVAAAFPEDENNQQGECASAGISYDSSCMCHSTLSKILENPVMNF